MNSVGQRTGNTRGGKRPPEPTSSQGCMASTRSEASVRATAKPNQTSVSCRRCRAHPSGRVPPARRAVANARSGCARRTVSATSRSPQGSTSRSRRPGGSLRKPSSCATWSATSATRSRSSRFARCSCDACRKTPRSTKQRSPSGRRPTGFSCAARSVSRRPRAGSCTESASRASSAPRSLLRWPHGSSGRSMSRRARFPGCSTRLLVSRDG